MPVSIVSPVLTSEMLPTARTGFEDMPVASGLRSSESGPSSSKVHSRSTTRPGPLVVPHHSRTASENGRHDTAPAERSGYVTWSRTIR